ncbi:MAG: hypothetical protein HY900_34555, partial [Deltaproteobacteria bacterium]|nr:hypothetical protein [Deltaproteobacteria bacterium]
ELLQELLSAKRYKLLEDAETLDPVDGYCLPQFFADVHEGLFEELEAEHPVVNVYRRELHRSYLAHLKAQLTASPPSSPRASLADTSQAGSDFPVSPTDTDFVAVGRGSLAKLGKKIEGALPRVEDERTLMHLQECLREIELLLGGPQGPGKDQFGSRAPVALQ